MASLVMFALAGVALVAAHGNVKPDFATWKEGQANMTADEAAAAAKNSKMGAVLKVATLLEGLQAQVLAEGEKEAQTYNKFAFFCKDGMADKSEAIQRGTDEKGSLSTGIGSLSQERTFLDDIIAQLIKDIEAEETALANAKASRSDELKTYEINAADLVGAIGALANATAALKAPSLLQLAVNTKALRDALMLADALGLGGASGRKVAAFLQVEPPAVGMQDYNFHSDGIVVTLEKLLTDFKSEKSELDAEEVRAVAAHEALVQEKTDATKVKNGEMADAKKTKAEKQAGIASKSEQLTTVAAVLLDDQAYLKELSSMCSTKAQTWDQRSKVRQDELSALTAAIAIIKGAVSESTSAATIRFAQRGVSVSLARAVARNPQAMAAIEAQVEASEAAPSLFQRGAVQAAAFLAPARLAKADEGRQAIEAFLRSTGAQLHSALLTSLARSAAEDPMAKVKVLIQELLERLLKEESNEASQKGWCDQSISAATMKREDAAGQVRELNGEMAKLEARRDLLKEDLAELARAISELETKEAEAERLRSDESAQNSAAVVEAQAGLSAISQAIAILNQFYKTASKGAVKLSLAQQGPKADAPDAGFAGGEAYLGAQGEAGGVIGMLEVIEGDFTRTVSATQAAEAEAKEDHLAFMTDTGKSLAEKSTAKTEKTSQKDDAEEELMTADESLQSQATLLRTAVKELLDLQPACVDTGMSYEERTARRQDELEALKKASCILERYTEHGPGLITDDSC